MTTRWNNDIEWKSFLRQLLIVSSPWTLFFCLGMQFGSTTVLVPQLRHLNITVSDEMVSWMTSGVACATFPWIFIHSVLVHFIGWKKTSIFVFSATIIGNIVFYFSTTPAIILISEGIFGITQGATTSIYVILISEYTSPKYRGMFLCIKSASFYWGVWVANAIGAFTYWRYIPVVSFIVSLHTLTVFFWPESPYWLASKNRFNECRKAHRWLKGDGEHAELELNKIIQSQTEVVNEGFRILKDLKFVSHREFYLPISLCMLAHLSYDLSGKLVITAYAVDTIKKMMKDQSTVYRTMLILDGITVFCAYVGCFMTKFFNRRTIWFVTFIIAIIFLLILSLYMYLIKLSICSENIYASIFLLVGFSLPISCGPMILNTSWGGELISSRYKSISIIVISLWFNIIYGGILKISPLIIEKLSLHGAFLFYALSSGFCICLMYFYLPETKDKTLSEIEEYFRDRKIRGEGSRLLVVAESTK